MKWKLLALLVLSGCIPPKVMLYSSTAAITADCTTTIVYATNTVERNPLLGPHPSTGRVLGLCGVAVAANALTPRLIHASPTAKRIWWGALTLIELRMFVHNLHQ